jgi:hypothetical protein
MTARSGLSHRAKSGNRTVRDTLAPPTAVRQRSAPMTTGLEPAVGVAMSMPLHRRVSVGRPCCSFGHTKPFGSPFTSDVTLEMKLRSQRHAEPKSSRALLTWPRLFSYLADAQATIPIQLQCPSADNVARLRACCKPHHSLLKRDTLRICCSVFRADVDAGACGSSTQ